MVPGFVHLAAVDAFDGDHIENDGFPIDAELFGRDAEEGDLAAVEHVVEHVFEGLRDAGHFHADVEAFFHAELFLNVFDRGLADIDGFCDVAHFLSEFEAERIYVSDDDVAGSGVFGDGGCHDADRAGSSDEHVFAEDFEFESGVDGVAERVEDRGDVEINVRLVLPDVCVRHGDELGESAVGVHADAARFYAQSTLARHTVSAASADEMAFNADDVADCEIDDVRADINEFADEFVADGRRNFDRALRPCVPIVNMQVGSADAAAFDTDHYIINAHFGHGNIFYPKTGFGLAFNYCFH